MRILIAAFFCAIFFSACVKPLADFAYQGEDKPAPSTIEFTNKSEKAETYVWDFGDGNQSTKVSPTHKYRSSGNYLVTLKAQAGKKAKTIEKRVLINAPEECLVEIETKFGNMIAILYDATPGHRDNFLKLIETGFYDSLLFHRVINGFMVQGGDPVSRKATSEQQIGGGGPGYQIPAEFVDSLVHVKGALAAARTNNPQKKSSGSQFYIVQGRPYTSDELGRLESRKDMHYTKSQRDAYLNFGGTPQLDREYTVFGRIIDGLEIIDQISAVKTDKRDRPIDDVRMTIRVIK